MNPYTRCWNCELAFHKHVEGKCLYEPTDFRATLCEGCRGPMLLDGWGMIPHFKCGVQFVHDSITTYLIPANV